MAVDRAALRAFLTGSPTSGYPNSLYAQVEKWRVALLAEAKSRKVTVHLTGTTDKPTHAAVDSVLSDCAAQTSERWPDTTRSDGRSWSLPDALEQIELCCRALDAADKAGAGGEAAPAPAPSPAPAKPSSWPPAGVAWFASWDGSDPRDGGKFKSTPWNYQSASPTVRQGRLRVELLPNGAQAPAKGASASDYARRCELEANLPESVTPKSGRIVWHRFDLTLVNFPVDTSSWNVTPCQWKGDGEGSPPLAVEVNKGQWTLVGINAAGKRIYRQPFGVAKQGVATTLVIGVTFGTSGHLTAYQDGAKTLDVAAATMHPGKGSYWKSVGIYADKALSGPLCLEVDRMAVGPTLASVT